MLGYLLLPHEFAHLLAAKVLGVRYRLDRTDRGWEVVLLDNVPMRKVGIIAIAPLALVFVGLLIFLCAKTNVLLAVVAALITWNGLLSEGDETVVKEAFRKPDRTYAEFLLEMSEELTKDATKLREYARSLLNSSGVG